MALRLMMGAAVLIGIGSAAGRSVHAGGDPQQQVCSGPWDQLRNHPWAIRWKTGRWQGTWREKVPLGPKVLMAQQRY
uniref:Uncharacterized protein n=1 Tax=Romanomermis culicivorax TaxID=13658 RepID=A0A915HVZ2_ROMCU